MISMPLSSGSFSSSSVRPARPPPNSVLKVSWKLRLIAANASANRWRVVSSMRLIASLVCAIESTRSLRCVRQEGVSRLELVELLDRHHVDGPEPVDLGAQRDDRLLGAERAPHRVVGRQRPLVARTGCGRRQARLVFRRASSAQITLASGATVPAASCAVDFCEHFVERRLDGLETRLGEVRQIALRRRARDIELGDVRANALELSARVLDGDFLLFAGELERTRPLPRAARSSCRRPSSARTSASSGRLALGDIPAEVGRTLRRWP